VVWRSSVIKNASLPDVRLRRKAESGRWHGLCGSSGYSSTPLPHGTDEQHTNQSTARESCLRVCGTAADSERKPQRSTPRRMSSSEQRIRHVVWLPKTWVR